MQKFSAMGTSKVSLLKNVHLSSKLSSRLTWSENLHDVIILRTKVLIITVEARIV